MGERLEALQEARRSRHQRQQSGRTSDDHDNTPGVHYWPSRRNRPRTSRDYSFTDSALGRGEEFSPGSDTEREQSNAGSARTERSIQNTSATSHLGAGQSMNVDDATAESHPVIFGELPRDTPRYGLEEKENAVPRFPAEFGHRNTPKYPRTTSPWTTAEGQKLKTMREAGKSWRDIAKTFPTRSEGSLKKHWYKDLHYADFDEEERVALAVAVKDYKASMWTVVGQQIGKPARACEQYAKEHWGEE